MALLAVVVIAIVIVAVVLPWGTPPQLERFSGSAVLPAQPGGSYDGWRNFTVNRSGEATVTWNFDDPAIHGHVDITNGTCSDLGDCAYDVAAGNLCPEPNAANSGSCSFAAQPGPYVLFAAAQLVDAPVAFLHFNGAVSGPAP